MAVAVYILENEENIAILFCCSIGEITVTILTLILNGINML